VLKTLETGTIHLLRGRLDPPGGVVRALEETLSAEERERADRFRFDHLRRRHIVGWGTLRRILGTLMDRAPGVLRFEREPGGKPYLAEPGAPSFNLSHSGEHLLVGVAAEGRLGVDLEEARGFPDLEALARRTFAEEEVAELLALPSGARVGAFFRGWTRKEAFIKAVGGGLAIPLTAFAVRLSPMGGNALRRLDPEVGEGPVEGWWVASLSGEDDPGASGDRSGSRRESGEGERDPEAGVAMAVAWDRVPRRIAFRSL